MEKFSNCLEIVQASYDRGKRGTNTIKARKV